MLTITVVSTKGGVGKTTLTANLGGLLHDLGLRVLMIDADIQPALTRYYQISHQAKHGLSEMVRSGVLTADCISHCQLPPSSYAGKLDKVPMSQGGQLHIVQSDTRDGKLQDWMATRNPMDMMLRFKRPLQHPDITHSYDVVLIDTQGAVGHIQDAAVMAADHLLVPVSPDVVSAREFITGTELLLERHECVTNVGMKMAPMWAVLSRAENTTDSRDMSALIRENFISMRGRVNMLSTVVPAAVAYRKAATSQVPVHWIDPVKASDTLHGLLWELIPSVDGIHASNHREYIDLNAAPSN